MCLGGVLITQLILRVQLLGGFSITYGEKPLRAINTARLQSLLAYLVLNSNIPQSRQLVAFQMWPDTSESNARNNLRQFLFQLRHLLPDHNRFLTSDGNTVCWHQEDNQEIDVQHFERCLKEIKAAEERADLTATRAWLSESLSSYHGDLLPNCYDDWIVSYREHLRQQFYSANQTLVRILEQQRDYSAALQTAKFLLSLDLLDENTYLTLMRLYDLNQNRSAARQVYQTAVETLRNELDAEPGDPLRFAYERLSRTSETHFLESETKPLTLVGRQVEWQQLQAAWKFAANGNVQLALITGEAGIGKSRLAEELYTWANHQGFTTARARSYAAEGRLSLAPVIEWLRSPTLRPHLNTLDKLWLTEVARLLPELLTENKDLTHPLPIGEYGQRLHFFEALARAVLAAPLPVLLWIDDLQWCDPETLEWLHFLLRFKPNSSLFVLGTVRSEESLSDHPLTGLIQRLQGEGKLVSIALSPLDAAETAQLARQIEGRELEVSTTLLLYRETEGNPLFIVETMRSGIRIGSDEKITGSTTYDMETRKLPPRVYAVIAGRLAQLSPIARRVIELGAAIGREFTLGVLLQAGQDDEANTITALDELWQKRILKEQDVNLFDFTHDKLREIAYAETSAPKHRMLHRQVAQALEVINAGGLDEVSAQIAAQYEQAAMFEQAIPYYHRAGDMAANIYANENAIYLWAHALALLLRFPASEKRDIQELPLQLALSSLYSIASGWTSPKVEDCLNRALFLCDKVGDLEQREQTLYGLQVLYIAQARFEKLQDTYTEMNQLFVRTHGSIPPNARLQYASSRYFLGHLLEAREQLESVIAVRDDRYLHNFRTMKGWNYVVHGSSVLSHNLWCLGYAQSAFNIIHASFEFARQYGPPFDRSKVITYLAMLQEWCADNELFRTYAEDAYTLTLEYKAPYYHAWADILLSFALVKQHPDSGHLTRLRDAIRTFIETGARLRLPLYYSLLARAYLQVGQIDDGLAALDQAFAESNQNNERWWDSELHRLRGELLQLKGTALDDVEASFQRALEIAQAQQAKSLELRAATSLARLWRANSRPEEAKLLLTRVYDWFTEGFETPDLVSARALIAQL